MKNHTIIALALAFGLGCFATAKTALNHNKSGFGIPVPLCNPNEPCVPGGPGGPR